MASTKIANITELRQDLIKLSTLSHLAIRELKDKHKELFQKVAEMARNLYDTDQYSDFLDLIKETFMHIDIVRAGSVGSYFKGCLLNNNPLEAKMCSNICSLSDKIDFCRHNVVWANMINDKFSLKVLHTTQSDKAYVLVNYPDAESFPGFSEDEAQQLSRFANQVSLIKYSPDGKNYIDLLGEFVDLKKLVTNRKIKKEAPSNDHNVPIILLIVIVILILFFIGWRFFL